MTLKEKFENNIIGINGEIKIADDYAIEFADWIGNLYPKKSYLLLKPRIELLEIFKKEKGL